MTRLLQTLLLLAPLVVNAGSAKLLSLKAETGSIGPGLKTALEKSLLPQLPGCVPAQGSAAKDTVTQSLRLEVQPDGQVYPADGASAEEWLDSGCVMTALKSAVVPKQKTASVIALEVEVKTTGAERGGANARVLKELARFCQLVAKAPNDDRSLLAARLSADPSLTGPARTAFRTVADTNPGDHLEVLQRAATAAGGTFACPALEPAPAEARRKK